MSRNINERRANNTSKLPGLRLNRRKGHLVIDVAWSTEQGRKATSYLADRRPLEATERAMQRRRDEVGAQYDQTVRQAWENLKAALRGSP
jgi:hypothetical protein